MPERQLTLSQKYREEEAFKEVVAILMDWTRIEELKALDRQYLDNIHKEDEDGEAVNLPASGNLLRR